MAVIVRSGEMKDARSRADPNDARLLVGRELACASCRGPEQARERRLLPREQRTCRGRRRRGEPWSRGGPLRDCFSASAAGATKVRLVRPTALIAALLAAYSAPGGFPADGRRFTESRGRWCWSRRGNRLHA